MNSVNPVVAVPGAEPASDSLIVGEVFPGAWVNASDGYVVHCPFASSTYSFWRDTGEGLESYVNDSCRRFDIPTCHCRRRFGVYSGPERIRIVNGFHAACVRAS